MKTKEEKTFFLSFEIPIGCNLREKSFSLSAKSDEHLVRIKMLKFFRCWVKNFSFVSFISKHIQALA